MKGVKYIAPCGDFSGYGEASRNYILSLHKKGIPVTVFPRNFDPNPPPIADKEQKEVLDSLVGKSIPYDVVITHLTPDLYPRYVEKGKYNIGYTAWETSLVHPKWAQSMGAVQEMWVPCDWNKEALVNSGVKAYICKIPHGIDPEMFSGLTDKSFIMGDLDSSTFKFYSIFQWTYRKNPDGLLISYFNAFDDTDNVVIVLKTYRMGSNRDKEYIRNQIIDIKKDMGIGKYPRVILIGDLLSKTQMLGLHLFGDCCVGLHRGEGWGLPYFEAGLAANPVVATGFSGNMEFMTDSNSYPVKYMPTYVSNMSTFNPWYLGEQQWAEPNQVHAAESMWHVFTHQEEAKKRGLILRDNIINNYSWDKVANIMVDRLSNL